MPAIFRSKRESAANSAAAVATKRDCQAGSSNNTDQNRNYRTAATALASNLANLLADSRRLRTVAITQHAGNDIFGIAIVF